MYYVRFGHPFLEAMVDCAVPPSLPEVSSTLSQDSFHTKYIVDDEFMAYLESLPIPAAKLNVTAFEDKAVLKNFLKWHVHSNPQDQKFMIESVWLHAAPMPLQAGEGLRLCLQSITGSRKVFELEERETVFAEVVQGFFARSKAFVVKPTRGRRSEGVTMVEPVKDTDTWRCFGMYYEHGTTAFAPTAGSQDEILAKLLALFREEWARMDQPQWVDPGYPGFIVEPQVVFQREVPATRNGGPSPNPELRVMWVAGIPIVATFKLTSKAHVVWRADMRANVENISKEVRERLDIKSDDEASDLITLIDEVVECVRRLALGVNMIPLQVNMRDPRRLVRTDFLVGKDLGSRRYFMLNEIQTNGDFNPIIHPYFEFFVDEDNQEWRNRMQDGSFLEGEKGAEVRRLILQYFRKGLRRPRSSDICSPMQLLRSGWYE